MIVMLPSRRHFIKISTAATTTAIMPASWVAAENVHPGSKIKLRFAVASDLHYGQDDTPFDATAAELVGWINAEKQSKRLDALFINGDLSNDSSAALLTLRDKHLAKLDVPYFAIKGNHDYVDGKSGSPTGSWMSLWGYPSNHTIEIGEFVFVMADTSAPSESHTYLAADLEWLKDQFKRHESAPAIFVMIHIQQRKHAVEGWPKHGVHDRNELAKAEAVMDLLEATPNVRAVFHGHNHLETGVYISGGRRYFFDSHVGGSWGAKRGYRIVEVHEDHRMATRQINAEDRVVSNRHELPA